MNSTQMHERLRLEVLRRIQRGTMSVSLLARQTGFGQSHLSNFLRSKRQLSLEAMDRILAAQHLTIADLMPALRQGNLWPDPEDTGSVPVVSHAAALFEPYIRPSSVQSIVQLPANALESVHSRAANTRRSWQRFVAVRIAAADALPMEPLVQPDALALIDRHYTSLFPYRPNRANLYAVRHLSRLTLRYVEFLSSRLVLRPHNLGFPLELIDIDPDDTPNDLLVGRVALVLNEL
jgi:transcriptional regulator with XRE-family HTH domain